MDETIYAILKVLFDFALEVWFSIVRLPPAVKVQSSLCVNADSPELSLDPHIKYGHQGDFLEIFEVWVPLISYVLLKRYSSVQN